MRAFSNLPIHSGLVQLTPPASEPITLDQAKAHLRVDISDDDALISSLIVAARRYCETASQRAFITQTWQYNLDAFPWFWQWAWGGGAIQLPKAPLQSVAYVKYLDMSADLQTLDTSKYQVDIVSQPGRIVPTFHTPWPATAWLPGAVQITFTCGYGDDPSDVPTPITQAMLLCIGHWYRARESVGEYGAEVPMGVEALLASESHGGGYY